MMIHLLPIRALLRVYIRGLGDYVGRGETRHTVHFRLNLPLTRSRASKSLQRPVHQIIKTASISICFRQFRNPSASQIYIINHPDISDTSSIFQNSAWGCSAIPTEPVSSTVPCLKSTPGTLLGLRITVSPLLRMRDNIIPHHGRASANISAKSPPPRNDCPPGNHPGNNPPAPAASAAAGNMSAETPDCGNLS